MRSVKTLILGMILAAGVPRLYAQDAAGAAQQVRKSAEQAAAQSTAPASKSAGKPAAAPAPAKSSSAAKTPAKSPAQASPAVKPAAPAQAAKPGTPPAQAAKAAPGTKPAAGPKPPAKPAATRKTASKKPAVKRTANPADVAKKAQAALEPERKVARRDPFEAMIGREATSAGASILLPQGKAGLQVSTLRLDGVVRAPNGMIAVVSNPQSRTYFLREGDQLYDGRVEKIAMDGVSFHEVGKDAFGKPVERQVNKRIYASAGEQQ